MNFDRMDRINRMDIKTKVLFFNLVHPVHPVKRVFSVFVWYMSHLFQS
jgi:hypothetical protein